MDRAVVYAQEVAHAPQSEVQVRQAASALYHATCAALLVWEGTVIAARRGDARRLLLARLLLEHRLQPRDPLAATDADLEGGIASQLLADDPVSLDTAATLLVP